MAPSWRRATPGPGWRSRLALVTSLSRASETRYWAYLLLFGGFRFVTSFLRLDPRFVDGLQEAQLLGLGYAVAGGIMLPILAARGRLDSSGQRVTTST